MTSPNREFEVCKLLEDPTDVFLYVLGFLVPPFPVFVRKGFWSLELLISVLLSMMFHFPGILYSWFIVYSTSAVTGSRAEYVDLERQQFERAERVEQPLGVANYETPIQSPSPLRSPVQRFEDEIEEPPSYEASSQEAQRQFGDHKVQSP